MQPKYQWMLHFDENQKMMVGFVCLVIRYGSA